MQYGDCWQYGDWCRLGRLEAPALEEGLLERYPVFVSVVLNHVSEATSVFWNALRCLQLLLEILGEHYLFSLCFLLFGML